MSKGAIVQRSLTSTQTASWQHELQQAQELHQHAGFVADPLQEQRQSPAKGIVHKYHGRVQLIVAGECAVHCFSMMATYKVCALKFALSRTFGGCLFIPTCKLLFRNG